MERTTCEDGSKSFVLSSSKSSRLHLSMRVLSSSKWLRITWHAKSRGTRLRKHV